MSTPETMTDTANGTSTVLDAIEAYERACTTLAAEYATLETARATVTAAEETYQQQGKVVELAKAAEKDARRQLQRALAGVDLVE